MNTKALFITLLGILFATTANSASIYKCTKSDKTVIFTDKNCPTNTTETLVHKETEQEIQNRQQAEKVSTLKRLIEGGQTDAAKEYALKNKLSEIYYQQLSVFSTQKAEIEKQKRDDEKQQQLAIEQQKLVLQKQQWVAEQAKNQTQQPPNNQTYYAYPYRNTLYNPPHHSQPKASSQLSSGGMTPISSGGMNPPMSFPSQTTVPHKHDMRK